ncbi:MAG: helix-turn-helix domain-containing protein [Treponema sp.]|jgi:transcriptional regulator with XRE-family HTH domain|nr:helix-turn-helix domain-containing protein [Treponema sp.]
MKERIRAIRRTLNLNQGEFAERIGIKSTALSMVELGKNALTEQNIRLICMTFNVNDVWLRTGKGEMFVASPYEKEFFEIYRDLMPETQQALLRLARDLLKGQKKLQEGAVRHHKGV